MDKDFITSVSKNSLIYYIECQLEIQGVTDQAIWYSPVFEMLNTHPIHIIYGHPKIRTLSQVYQNDHFLISQAKHMLWVLKRTISMRRFLPSQLDGSFEHPKHILKIMGKKIFTILC